MLGFGQRGSAPLASQPNSGLTGGCRLRPAFQQGLDRQAGRHTESIWVAPCTGVRADAVWGGWPPQRRAEPGLAALWEAGAGFCGHGQPHQGGGWGGGGTGIACWVVRRAWWSSRCCLRAWTAASRRGLRGLGGGLREVGASPLGASAGVGSQVRAAAQVGGMGRAARPDLPAERDLGNLAILSADLGPVAL